MGSTKEHLHVSYGQEVDFYATWLDEAMNYSCALFSEPGESLEIAQQNKLKRISRLAGVRAGESRLLDIGCGWGANLSHQVRVNQLKDCVGITLAGPQYERCVSLKLPGVRLEKVDFWKFEPDAPFDAATSIGMAEHLVSTTEATAGRAVAIYRKHFARVHGWLKPGARFGLQLVVRNVFPRKREEIEDLKFATDHHFPGTYAPLPEEILQSVYPYFEVREMYSERVNYWRTFSEWLRRFDQHESHLVEKYGRALFDSNRRYLETCVRAFEKGWLSLCQFGLERID